MTPKPHSELLARIQMALQGNIAMPTYLNDSQKDGLIALRDLEEQYETLRAVAQRVLDEADAETNGTLWPPSENWHDAESDLWRLLNSNPSSEPGLTGDDAVVASSASGSETSSPAKSPNLSNELGGF